MAIFKGGNSLDYFQGGSQLNGRFVGGNNLLGDTLLLEFLFENAGIQFSVTRDGDVTLTIENGTIASATWLNGGTTGPTSMTITRTNTVVVNVPAGFSNTGETVTGTVTATQVASTRPFVVTNEETFLTSTSATLNGQITDDGGYPILDSGFFYVEAVIQSVNTVVNIGTYQHDGGNGFISEAISVEDGEPYSYVAAARNQLGWTYGNVVVFETPQALATAEYNLYPADQPTGGTLTSTTNGDWSNWSGAVSIQPSASSDNPTSAICGTSNPTCPISRQRTNIEHYTGAQQTQEYICELDMAGAGTPTCNDMNGDGQPDPLGTVVAGPTLNNGQRNVVVIETQTLDVTNSIYVPPPVLGCTNPGATNYDENATQDDGSCEFPAIPGCTDPDASNYNPDATADDGSCEFIFPGCTNPLADNYDPSATVDNGTCIVTPTFTSDSITVSNCSLNQAGTTGFAVTNYGTTTAIVGSYPANNNQEDRTVDVTFEITIPIPEGFKNAGTPMPFEFTTDCPQPGTGIIPMFIADSATVIFLPDFSSPTQNADDGDVISLPGDAGATYTVTNPNVNAGTVQVGTSGSGAGNFSLLNSPGRTHSFTISGSPETYSFRVFAGGAPSGGGGFNPFF